jgi:hypothetical protein
MKNSEAEMHALMAPTGLRFTIDSDGDAQCLIGGLGPTGDRTQGVWVSAQVDEWGEQYKDRDVFAVVAELPGLPRSHDLMLKLLQLVAQNKGGGLIATDTRLLYRFDVPVTASAEHLRDTVYLCAAIADKLESALTESDAH